MRNKKHNKINLFIMKIKKYRNLCQRLNKENHQDQTIEVVEIVRRKKLKGQIRKYNYTANKLSHTSLTLSKGKIPTTMTKLINNYKI